MAVQAVIDPQPFKLIANLAPAPSDIVWNNTYISRRERMIRSWSITVFVVFLTFIWLAPVGSIAGLSNICTIGKVWPGLAKLIMSNPTASSLIQSFLPTVVLTLLNVAIPYLYDCKYSL